MVVTIGVDAHKEQHTAVAVDDAGREIGRRQVPNTPAGWEKLRDWAARLGQQRRWGVEGAWNYGRGLAQYLVAAEETVYEVNPRLTADSRRRSRKLDKNDCQDALAVAKKLREDSDELPRVVAEDETVVLDLLTTERESALAEATRIRNRIHGLLLQIDPEYKSRLPKLSSKAGASALERYESPRDGAIYQQRAATVRRLVQRLRLVLEQVEEITTEIETLTRERFSPLMRLHGVGGIAAGALAGILGPGFRFSNDAQLAAYAGVAPIEASSAGRLRHRLNRGGNRRLNAILYRIILTQSRWSPETRAYLARRMGEGKSKREAIRALKRFIIRAIWRLWQECQGKTPEEAIQVAA